jgi:uncharacterized protein YbaP (TraB family)
LTFSRALAEFPNVTGAQHEQTSALIIGFTILLAPLVAVPGLFWSVESGNAKVYLLGSMHAGTPDLYPLPAFIDEAYMASDALVVEAM